MEGTEIACLEKILNIDNLNWLKWTKGVISVLVILFLKYDKNRHTIGFFYNVASGRKIWVT